MGEKAKRVKNNKQQHKRQLERAKRDHDKRIEEIIAMKEKETNDVIKSTSTRLEKVQIRIR